MTIPWYYLTSHIIADFILDSGQRDERLDLRYLKITTLNNAKKSLTKIIATKKSKISLNTKLVK